MLEVWYSKNKMFVSGKITEIKNFFEKIKNKKESFKSFFNADNALIYLEKYNIKNENDELLMTLKCNKEGFVKKIFMEEVKLF